MVTYQSGPVDVATDVPGTWLFVSNIPAGWALLGWRFQILEEIVGTDGTPSLEIIDPTYNVIETLASGLSRAANTKASGGAIGTTFGSPVVTPTDGCAVRMRLLGGSDNIASGGAVRAEMKFLAGGMPDFADA